MLAILCSGQGGQHAAMFALTGACASAQPVFEAAAVILGEDPRQWVGAAAQTQLYANTSAQLLCCTQALAAWAALDLQRSVPGEELMIAGYSVGELAAWGCAGLIAPRDVLALAISRARAMDRAAGSDTGMAAIRGLPRPDLQLLCRTHGCEIAIVLSEDSFIVGGLHSALSALGREAMLSGAQRITPLPIGVAAHTSCLAAASVEFRAQLRAVPVGATLRPGVRLLCGLDGAAVRSIEAGLDQLAQEISHPLDWYACLTACREAGVTRVLELGPGRALASMSQTVLPQARCRSLDEFRTLDGVHAWLRAEQSA
jgi:[acyl-carrier-protein] S-malonyltransferase